MRICFIGDSFVNGTGDDTCLGWTGRICSQARLSGHDVTHYNLGVRRDTSEDVARRWHAEARARLTVEFPGRLVFSFGANDCASQGDTAGPRVAPARSPQVAEAILQEASGWLPTLMVGPLPIGGDPPADARVQSLSAELARLCARLGLPYLPVHSAMQRSQSWRSEAACGDGTHPNAAGYQALAEVVMAWPAWQAWFKPS